jgi:hypothetical protein
MIIRPLILRSPDGDAGGAAAVASPSPALSTPGIVRNANGGTGDTTGPKTFEGGNGAPAKSRMEMLAERAGVEAPKPKEKPVTPPLPKPPEKKPEAKTEPPKTEEPSATATPAVPEKQKVNPWKERDKERARADAAEARIKEYEANKLKEEDRTVLEFTRKRNEELENEIRFANWKKSSEYQKHLEPYESKWAETVGFLSKIPVVDKASGESRAGNNDDLTELFWLDPVAADARALEMVGGSPTLAARLIGQVEKCQELSSALQKAEKDALANGKTREAQAKAKSESENKALRDFSHQAAKSALDEWNKDPDAASFDEIKREDGKELTPDEQEHNAIVTRGKELVRVFEQRVSDCKTKEEAQALIRKQAAAIKRAAHFGAVRRLLVKERKAHAETKAALAKFEATTPDRGGRQASNPALRNGNHPSDGRRERLQKYAGRGG